MSIKHHLMSVSLCVLALLVSLHGGGLQAQTGYWEPIGGPQPTSLSNPVLSMTVLGDSLIIGGQFTSAGRIADNDYLTIWTNDHLQRTAPVYFYDDVYATAAIGNDIYVGGGLLVLTNPSHLVRFTPDGVWDLPGGGLNGLVWALRVDGTDLYAGGDFTDAGGNPDADFIAKWNGVSWEALGTGVNGTVKAIAVSGGEVYVGGNFSSAGGVANTNGIARWTGSAWESVGGGVNNVVSALTVSGSDLYVGGQFTDAGGNTAADGVARWTGSTWEALGNGLPPTILSLYSSGNNIYAGGLFFGVGGDPNANCILKWNGASWESLGSGLFSFVYSITEFNGMLYAGGAFADAGGNVLADYLARFNGQEWEALGSGPDYAVLDVAVSGDQIYLGGFFTGLGGSSNGNFVGKWNGSDWETLGSGVQGVNEFNSVISVAVNGSDVYVGGDFPSAGNLPNTLNIAKWNGSGWEALGDGLNGQVNDIAVSVSGSDVYAAGLFTAAGGDPGANYIAKWTGSDWQALGGGLDGGAWSIAIADSLVYVAGGFSSAGGVPNTAFIAVWNGSSWQPVGSGISSGQISSISSIEVSGTNVYVGGRFIGLNGVVGGDNIIRWNGNDWSAMDGGLPGGVQALEATPTTLYVGGNFFSAGGDSAADGLAKWNGTSWEALGSGLGRGQFNPIVSGLAATNDGVVAGGWFTFAGGQASARIARWHDTPTGIEDEQPPVAQGIHLTQNYPNPFNPSTTIRYQLPKSGNVKLTIYNMLSQQVRTLVNEQQPIGDYQVQWDGRNDHDVPVTSGLYFYQIITENYVETRKMLLLR